MKGILNLIGEKSLLLSKINDINKNYAFKTSAVCYSGSLSGFIKSSLPNGGEFTIVGGSKVTETPFDSWWNGVAFKSDGVGIWDVYLFHDTTNKIYFNKYYSDHWNGDWTTFVSI